MTSSTIQRRAVKQHGCSFREILRRMGAAGLSINEASQRLGYSSPTTLYRIIKENGWHDLFLPSRLTNGRLRSMNNLKAHRLAINGVVDSFSGHARRAGLPRSTAWKRYTKVGPDWGKVFGVYGNVRR